MTGVEERSNYTDMWVGTNDYEATLKGGIGVF